MKPDVCTFIALFKSVKQWQLGYRARQRVDAPAAGAEPESAGKHLQREARQVCLHPYVLYLVYINRVYYSVPV